MRFAEVTWHDAHADSEETLLASEVAEFHGPVVVTSSGYVVKSDKVGITLAGCHDSFFGELGYERSMFIPRVLIQKIRYLK